MADSTARVHYFPQQFLRAQDFADEQAYHLNAHRRHNISHHTWGIVVGLELVTDGEGNLFIEAGVAVDGFGRDILLPARTGIGPEVFADRGSDILDVYLNYNRSGSDETPQGYAGCDENGDPPFYRWQEQPFRTFDAPDSPPVDRRRPPSTLDSDLSFDATRTPPDEPERRWPVFLGQITLDRTNEKQPFTVDLAGRPYVGLVGEMVHAPSGRARVQIGTERQGDPNRFAVFVPAVDTSPSSRKPRLAIRRGGTVEIRGTTTLHGNLTLDGRSVEFRPGPERAKTGGPPRIYHVENKTEHELRVEMVDPDTAAQQVVIGAWSTEQQSFQPCLTIANDCTVTVHGDLVVEGKTEGLSSADVVDRGLGDEAQRLVTASFSSGLIGGNALLSELFRTPFPTTPDVALQEAASLIAVSSAQREMFANLLVTQDPSAASALREALAADAPDSPSSEDESP
jgi:hypothetical protein